MASKGHVCVVGDRIWVPHDEHAWLCGFVTKVDDKFVEINTDVGKLKWKAADANALEPCGRHLDDTVENLVDIDELSEGAILHHVRKRFKNGQIYTHVGAILVAVNPFENLPIYSNAEMKRAAGAMNLYPHVFVTANVAFSQLKTNLKNQSVLISGESGAGKTETTKKVLSYLANVAPASKTGKGAADEPGVEEKILQSNPLLEALGNAKTLRNNNSSRFGKWMKVDFDHSFRIHGCEIVNYLLEKSRVVTQNPSERNYHIFYQILAGADADMKAKYQLQPPSQYHYLNTSGCVSIEGVDDAAEYREVLAAMKTLNFTGQLFDVMHQILVGVLNLGNVVFEGGAGDGSSKIAAASMPVMQHCAQLLGLELEPFEYALTQKRVQMGRGSVVNIKLDVAQAIDNRDTLSKALYSNLFDFTIRKINETLKTHEAPFSIGILDIFGFEVFDTNSFEQLCINYANEKLQFHFNEVIFNEEMKMYTEEGVPSEHITFVDNGECVNLIEGKPIGLLSLLDEECQLGKATDQTYINKLDGTFSANKSNENRFFIKSKTQPLIFTVCHFAGPVEYNTTNFLDKNKDTLSATLQEVMMMSSFELVSSIFTTLSQNGPRRSSINKSKAQSNKTTLGGQFRNQLIGLVANLRLTEPHFIRCVKPNHQKKPAIFDGQLALRQLRYAGLFEAIRIRKSGFAYRVTHDVFCRQYATLVDGLQQQLKRGEITPAEACIRILQSTSDLKKELWHVGVSKVFIKTNNDRMHLERMRVKRVEVFAIRIQAGIRSFLARMKLNAKKFEEKKRLQRLLMMDKIKADSAVHIQKHIRGYLVRRAMELISELISLRRALAQRDVSEVDIILKRIEAKAMDGMAMFEKEVTIAKTMSKLIRIQDKFIRDLDAAIDKKNVNDLNRLLVKADRLDMSLHPSVLRGREILSFLHQKRHVMVTMIEFLKHENEYCEVIPETLEQAAKLGVDSDFIAKVQRIYESASPRLRARNKLRRAIEVIDLHGINESCVEVRNLQSLHPRFAEMELRAAENLLNMISLEAEMSRYAATITGPRLTDEIIALCNEICTCPETDKATRRALKAKLVKLCGNNNDRMEMVVRSFKWSKVYCIWKYPEVQDTNLQRSEGSVIKEETSEFFGFRPAEARITSYIIRSLHREVDPILGTAPASLQAMIGALEVPSEIADAESEDETEIDGRHKMILKGPTFKQSPPRDPEKATQGRRTSFYFLEPDVESQLIESRRSVQKQREALMKTKSKIKLEKRKNWH